MNEGKVTSAKPGQPIRFPVEAKGRHEPLHMTKWLGEYTINVPDMHEMDNTGAGKVMKH